MRFTSLRWDSRCHWMSIYRSSSTRSSSSWCPSRSSSTNSSPRTCTTTSWGRWPPLWRRCPSARARSRLSRPTWRPSCTPCCSCSASCCGPSWEVLSQSLHEVSHRSHTILYWFVKYCACLSIGVWSLQQSLWTKSIEQILLNKWSIWKYQSAQMISLISSYWAKLDSNYHVEHQVERMSI